MSADLWRPRSPCGPGCLSGEAPPTVSPATRALRLLGLVGLVAGVGLLTPVFPLLGAAGRVRLLRRAARWFLAVLGVGFAPPRRPVRPGLIVANHVSWLDCVVLLAFGQVRQVAKAEVRAWPVIGAIVAATGTVFVDRSRPKSLPRTVAEVRDALAQGESVAVFAEGTTSCGRAVGPFRPAMFQAAIDAGVPVVPVSLRYRLPDGTDTPVAAFVGDETLLASLRRVVRARGLRAAVRVGTAVHPDAGASRRSLARLCAGSLAADRLVPINRTAPAPTGDLACPWATPVAPARSPRPARARGPVRAV